MGYEVHIVRLNDFDNSEEESNIQIDEWKDLVNNDKELTWQQYSGVEGETDFEYCYWLSHPEIDESNRPWFHFFRGSISTKWTDIACLWKLLQMAENLNARLRGDDGEYYDSEAIKKLESATAQQKVEKKKPFWKFW
jgi:hypothetical protein